MENTQKSRRWLKISTFNMWMVISASVICICLLAATHFASKNYERLVLAADDYIRLEAAAKEILRASDYLTEQVRLYAETQDPEHLWLYFGEVNVSRRRENALETMYVYSVDPSRDDGMETAAQYSDELMILEMYAMKLVAAAEGRSEDAMPPELANVMLTAEDTALTAEEKLEKARGLLFSGEYQKIKSIIYANVDYFARGVLGTTEDRLVDGLESLSRSIRKERVLIVLLVALNMVTFFVITLLVVKPLAVFLRCIRERTPFQPAGAYEFRYLAQIYNDIYARSNTLAASEAFLREKAEQDALTGILNRYMFQQVSTILKESEMSLALVLIDVDKFKDVNDTFGHAEGDRVLARVAKLLSESLRGTDYVFRIGGDEFAAILPEVDASNVESIRRKLLRVNDRLRAEENGYTPVSLSIGIACSDRGYQEGLYEQADRALYYVKENGRCGCMVYEDGMESRR